MEWLGLILVLGSLVGSARRHRPVPPRAPASRRRCACSASTSSTWPSTSARCCGSCLGAKPSAARATAGGVFGISAIFYAGFWLARIVPRYRPLPAWVDRYPSGIDYTFWAIMIVALAVALFT